MIYLIHFDTPIGNDRHQAQHYLGFVDGDEQTVQARLLEHRAGWGARILAHCNQRGIHYDVARILPGDRNRERQIKNTNNLRSYCPICKQLKKAAHVS